MSQHTTTLVDIAERTPVTVWLTPAQLMCLELLLGELRAIDPALDDNAVVDRIFAAGLDAEWTTLKEIAP